MSAALQLVHCRPPEPVKCEIIKGGMDGIAEFECGAQAQFRSILDGWIIKRLLLDDRYSPMEIAAMFGVHERGIFFIRDGKTWTSVQPKPSLGWVVQRRRK